jgi:hypothetical protein
MGEGFIVRKGGAVTEQALAPTITEVSTTDSEIVFTITNNDASTAVILWEVDDSSPDANSLELATGVTSSNITVDSLADDTTFIVYATANVTGKIKSEVASESITTDETITYTAATGGTTLEYDSGGKRYKSHTFTSDDDFIVSTVGDNIDDRNKVDYLIIAGGGGGGGTSTDGLYGGGAGAGSGGYRTTLGTSGRGSSARTKITVTAQTYGIVIGAGGTGGARNNDGANGTASTGLGISTVGGGGGRNSNDFNQTGISGGAGGGAGPRCDATRNGGAGTTDEGFDGGNNPGVNSGGTSGGGGSGSAGIASEANENGQNGGNGLANTLRTGSSESRAGGGGGGAYDTGSIGNGQAGGGNGGLNRVSGENATANTGSGGGGSGGTFSTSIDIKGGNGAAGIVVIRYEIAPTV